MTDKFRQLAESLAAELRDMQAQIKAAETRIRALTLTEAELTARIGNHQRNLEIKKQVEAFQAKARKVLGDEAA